MNYRTDLALEAALPLENHLPEGVALHRKQEQGITVEQVRITSPAGEQAIGKPMGEYSTLSLPPLK